MASGRINRNVLIYISGGSGCTPLEAKKLRYPTPATSCWVRWAHIRSHLDGGPQGWDPHTVGHHVDVVSRPAGATRRDLRITPDGRGTYKSHVSKAPCDDSTRLVYGGMPSHGWFERGYKRGELPDGRPSRIPRETTEFDRDQSARASGFRRKGDCVPGTGIISGRSDADVCRVSISEPFSGQVSAFFVLSTWQNVDKGFIFAPDLDIQIYIAHI